MPLIPRTIFLVFSRVFSWMQAQMSRQLSTQKVFQYFFGDHLYATEIHDTDYIHAATRLDGTMPDDIDGNYIDTWNCSTRSICCQWLDRNCCDLVRTTDHLREMVKKRMVKNELSRRSSCSLKEWMKRQEMARNQFRRAIACFMSVVPRHSLLFSNICERYQRIPCIPSQFRKS